MEDMGLSPAWAVFYRGRTVLVTGHTGFKGSWLVTWLTILGARVVGFSLPAEEGRPSLFVAGDLGRDVHSHFGDVRDLESLAAAFATHRPEIVFHLAAQPLIRRSYREPIETYATNVMGTAHVLEAARWTSSVRAVVTVTSDKCYENREWPWPYREDDRLGGRDPYSSSKGCAELVTAAYRASFFEKPDAAAVASARAGNVVGGGDWGEDRLVPDLMRAIWDGVPALIRHPDAVRPWQHVLEPLRGYLMLGERLAREGKVWAEGWNFGPREEDLMTVGDLADAVCRSWGQQAAWVKGNAGGPAEARLLRVDSSKARHRLGWRSLLDVPEAVALTVEWYRAYRDDPAKAGGTTAGQIKAYMQRCRP